MSKSLHLDSSAEANVDFESYLRWTQKIVPTNHYRFPSRAAGLITLRLQQRTPNGWRHRAVRERQISGSSIHVVNDYVLIAVNRHSRRK